MNCARMSMKNQWSNMGRNAAKSGLPVESILTGKPSIDELIRAGYAKGLRKKGTLVPLTNQIEPGTIES